MALTIKQKVFIKAFFSPEVGQDFDKALIAAGYPPETLKSEVMTPDVMDAIRKESESLMALKLPNAAMMLQEVMDNPETKGAATKLKSAMTILDRQGLTRQERDVDDRVLPTGLVVLPAREPVN